MSQWRITTYDEILRRELTSIVLLPDLKEDERRPFTGYLLIADETREAEWFSLHTALEVTLCKQNSLAAVCLPGWILKTDAPLHYLLEELPARFSSLFPVELRFIHGEGSANKWMNEHLAELEKHYVIQCPYQ